MNKNKHPTIRSDYQDVDVPSSEINKLENITKAASIIAVGNVVSRVLGLVRDIAKSYYFGATGLVSAFNIASKIPMWLYDLLAGGMINAALIPVFSSYSKPENRRELWLITSFLLTLCVSILTPLVIIGEIFAEELVWLVSGGMSPYTLEIAAKLLRITLPAILFLNLAGILAGLLYSLNRFTFPAFNAAIFNLAIVLATVLFAKPFGVYSLAIGLLVGSTLQVILQLPGIKDSKLHFAFSLHHKAVRTIGKLYVPIALGLIIDMVSRGISYRLASTTGDQSIAWMDYATTIMQFPLGLTSTAISIAVLPTLARQAQYIEKTNSATFLETLSQALNLVIILIIPATVGLFVLAEPVIQLIFEHGDFLPSDTTMTTIILKLYLFGIIAAAIDLPLINAFYARKEAWTPALVGVVGVLVYLAAALFPSLYRPMKIEDLIIANALQLCYHALTMYILVHKRIGNINNKLILFTASKAIVSASIMTIVTVGTLWLIGFFAWPTKLVQEFASVFIPGILGTLCYFMLMQKLNVPEISFVFRLINPVRKYSIKKDEH